MSESIATLIPLGAVVMVIAVVLVMTRFRPRVADWNRLAAPYAFNGTFSGRSISCAGRMGFSVTRDPWLIDVGLMPEGLYLHTTRLLGYEGPALLVPWREVRIANRHLVAFKLLTVYIGPEKRQLDLRGAFDKSFEADLLEFYDAGRGNVRATA